MNGFVGAEEGSEDESEIKSNFSFEQVSGARLEDVLQLRHLERLRQLFEEHVPREDAEEDDLDGATFRPFSRKPAREPGNLTLEEFKETMGRVVGRDRFTDQLEKIFAKLDTSCDGHVDWSEFCTYLLLYLRESDYLSSTRDTPFCSDPKLRHLVHNRQEPTSRLLITNNPSKIVTVSKAGTICVWDSHLSFEAVYQSHREEEDAMRQKRRFHMWVMDAVYMSNCHKMVLATTARDLRFFDFGSGSMIEDIHLYALPNIVMSLEYYFDPKNPNGPSHLFSGDEFGNIYHFHFLRPSHQLFDIPHQPDQIQRVWMEEIGQHFRFVEYTKLENVHDQPVLSIRYMADNQTVISCSSSPNASVVIYDVGRRQTLYKFCLRRGCECFELCKQLNLLITGSSDYLVRVWNPYVTNRPSAILQGHTAPVLGLRIHDRRNQVITYARDMTIKVWDLKDYMCLQTINVRLPGQVQGKVAEHMMSPMILHHDNVTLTINDYFVVYKLGKPPDPPSLTPMTHKTQLCCAIYNPMFKQVISGSDDSCIISWDVETGAKCLQFNNAHEGEEITCLVVDHSLRRMMSGARNGSVKVWNVQNGHQLHSLEPVAEAEVTGILPLHDRQFILTVGWSRRIARYEDNKQDTFHLKLGTPWKGGSAHKDDVLACDYCPPYLVATGSFDGEIILWSLETEQILLRLRFGYRESLARTLSRLQGLELPASRPNSRHRKNHKPPPQGIPPPVDKLLFLRRRVLMRQSEAAILISSEAGTLRWWSLYGSDHDVGHFYAPKITDESVLGLCLNEDNTLLISGDTKGWIRQWRIDNYCIDHHTTRRGNPPPLLREFHAHESGAVVSLAWVPHDRGDFVLTAATDCCSKLFSIEGDFVGTFGQRTPWDLRDPATWEAPRPSRLEAEALPVTSKGDDDAQPSNELQETHENGLTVTLLTGGRRADTSPESNANPDVSSEVSAPASQGPRPHTTAGGSHKSQLGLKAEMDFQRIRQSRFQRRMDFGEVATEKALRFGGRHCSPFAALSTTDFKVMQIPKQIVLPSASAGSDSTRKVCQVPFLQSFEETATRLRREKTWAHGERSRSIVKLPAISKNS